MQTSIQFQKVPFKSWGPDERPREKFLTLGAESLTDAEILANLIGSGNSELTPIDIARHLLLSVNHDLRKLGHLTYHQIMENPGIGHAKALTILSAIELGRRRAFYTPERLPKITSPRDCYNLIKPHMIDLEREEFWVLFLNAQCEVVHKKRMSSGNTITTLANIRGILKEAILTPFVVSCLACHNHPSGNPKPSPEDVKLTNKLKAALEVSEFVLHDHIIFAEDSYYSFAEDGAM